ncbi:MAG: glycogen/starch synthase, partial [Acidimicrobiia bacterium]|nr:glycogen/starch synthase [Acidimicrobiia bacterium]
MHIGFLASELAPYAQAGGLGDVARWLPIALARAGHRVDVAVPHYDVLDRHGEALRPVRTPREADLGDLGVATFSILGDPAPGRPTIWLVDLPEWFRRGDLYGDGDGHLRYTAFVRAAMALAEMRGRVPDVLHANDWHTAHAPLVGAARGGPWAGVPTVLTVHNPAFQGWFPTSDLDRLGLGGVADRLDDSDIEQGWVSTLKEGIRHADLVTTVSPSYADEILTPDGGMGLEEEFRSLGDRLVGILNGIGDDWDPATDPALAAPFDAADPSGKVVNTGALRAHFGLADRRVPVLGVVSRLTEQKGFHLAFDTLEDRLAAGAIQLVAIGTGEPAIEESFQALSDRFPDDAGYHRGFDIPLSHLIEAGSDLFLMPSRFEPCGLNQMYSMAYGTI